MPPESTISRYRPTVLAITIFAAGLGVYLVYTATKNQNELPPSNLHRSNAVRRHRPSGRLNPLHDGEQETATNEEIEFDERSGIQFPEDLETSGIPADDAATEISTQPDTASSRDGQRLRQLLFAISKNKAKNEGFIHRRVNCDGCNRSPIVGVRYRCANCPDFDLCEECEAGDVHLKTHVFYKINIPSPLVPQQPQPVWYPGEPHQFKSSLKPTLLRQLSSVTGYSGNEVDGQYQQFTCIANTPLGYEDSYGLSLAINRAAFDKWFVPLNAGRRSLAPNLIFDRLFAFYDTNKDKLIDFAEFVKGNSLVHNKHPPQRMKRVFKGFDLDDDGYVSRIDFLKMFKAFYILNKELTLEPLKAKRDGDDVEEVIERRTPKDFVKGSRPLPSYFRSYRIPRPPQTTYGKSVDENGDLVITDGGEVLERVYDDGVDIRDVIRDEIRHPAVITDSDIDLLEAAVHNDPSKPAWLHQDNLRFEKPDPSKIDSQSRRNHVEITLPSRRLLYITVEPEDREGVVDEGIPMENIEDENLLHEITQNAYNRVCRGLVSFRKDRSRELEYERARRKDFYLDYDPEDTEIYSEGVAIGLTEDIDLVEHELRRKEKYGSLYHPRTRGVFETIYAIAQQAINEGLDPLFKVREGLAVEVEHTKDERDEFRQEIEAYLLEDPRDDPQIIQDLLRKSSKPKKPLKPKTATIECTSPEIADSVLNDDPGRPGLAPDPIEQHFDGVAQLDETARHLRASSLPLQPGRASEPQMRTSHAAAATAPWSSSSPSPPARTSSPSTNLTPISSRSSSPHHDPTMPQFRPNTLTSLPRGRGPSPKRIAHLAALHVLAAENKARGGPARINYAEFRDRLREDEARDLKRAAGGADEMLGRDGAELLQWVGGWVDIVQF